MAAGTRHRADRAARLSALEATVATPAPDDEPTLGDLVARLDAPVQEVLQGWLTALAAPKGSSDRAYVCCKVHGVRRVWAWLKLSAPATAAGVALIGQEHSCPYRPPAEDRTPRRAPP